MKIRTIHLKEGEQIEITFKGEKVLRVGSEKDYTGHDILVDLTSDEFSYNCLAKRRLDKQLKDQK